VAAPWGEIVQSVGERIVQLDGQFLLVLDDEVASVDRLFDEASSGNARATSPRRSGFMSAPAGWTERIR